MSSAAEPWSVPPKRGRGARAADRLRAADTARVREAVRVGAVRAASASRSAARSGAVLLRTKGADLTLASRQVATQILATAGPELRTSLWKLRTVRGPQDAMRVLEEEIEHLLVVVTPMLVEHPLPIRRAAAARLVVGGAAAAVAVGEELDEVAALFSAGTSVAPSVPLIAAAAFVALSVEVAVAASLRVHDLRAAGIVVMPDAVAADVVRAMSGGRNAPRGTLTRQMVKRIAARVLSRWGTGLVPVVGAAYSAWDAQQTIGAIRRLPATRHERELRRGIR